MYIPEIYEKPTIPQKLKSNHCNCEICIQMRVCLLNYHSFETNDQLSTFLKIQSKQHVINIISIFKNIKKKIK